MSVRFVGDQLLKTAPGVFLDGASTVSASFWIQANPGNDVAVPGGVDVFGDCGGTFSATLSGMGSLRLRWSAVDGPTSTTSALSLTLIPGVSYHVAATWQPGLQRYYLNGVLVGSDSQAGTPGPSGVPVPHPYRVGSDQAGVDVTIDQPTIWAGYTLTAQDAAALCYRSSQPTGIAPSSIALGWSLAGKSGATAAVGDAGLADVSPNNRALVTIAGTAPRYRADLAYLPSPTIGRATASASGQSVVIFAQDGTGVDSGITGIISPDEIQSLKFSGPPAGDAFTLSFGGQSTAPIPVTIAPPAIYGLWTFPTVAGHSYDLATTFPGNYYSISEYFFETIQGGSVVATQAMGGGQGIPNDPPLPGFNDPGVNWLDGTPVPWATIASGVVATGSTIQVRVTGSPSQGYDGYFVIDGLRVHDSSANSIAYYDDASPHLQVVPPDEVSQVATGQSKGFDGTLTHFYSISGTGPMVNIIGGGAALQAALQALPTIGLGNVLVEDLSSSAGGDYMITFYGSLADGPRALLSSGDPTVEIAELSHGGQVPALTINGGRPIPLYDWIWTEAAPLPYALCPLPQSAPAVQTYVVHDLPYAQSSYWINDYANGPPDDSSLSGSPVFGSAPGLLASFTFAELPIATYQVAITYPHAPFIPVGTNSTFTPSTATQFLVQDSFGDTLGSFTVDQSVVPSNYQDAGGRGWHVLGSFATTASNSGLVLLMTTVGLPAGQVAILDAVQLTRTSPDTSVVINPGDSATLAVPAGWLATQVGPVPAIPNLRIDPPTPTAILPAFDHGPKTMEVGYNIEPAAYSSTFLTHSNLIYLSPANWRGVLDANGYPTKLSALRDGNGNAEVPVVEINIVTANNAFPGNADPWQGVPMVNPGLFLLTWDGDQSVTLSTNHLGTTVVEQTQYQVLTGTTGNRRVYDIQSDPAIAAGVAFNIQIQSTTPDPTDPTGGLYLIHLANLAIYPPDPSDPTGKTIWGLNVATGVFTPPPKFHPSFLDKLQGSTCVRFLDPLNTNTNPAFQLSDYKPTTHLDRVSPWLARSVGIARVQAPAASYFVIDDGLAQIQVETTTPHGLFDGSYVQFSGCGTAEFAGGTSLPLGSTYGLVHVVDPTTLVIAVGAGPGMTTPMTNTLTGGAVVAPDLGSLWPLQDLVDLVEAIGAPRLWYNAPITIDITPGGGAYQIAAFFASALPKGIKLHVEPGNECWNYEFPTYFWSSLQNARITGVRDGKYETFYARQAKAIHDQFLAAFTAAGRADDLVRVVGVQGSFPGGTTAPILQQLRQFGASFEELCVAPYPNPGPSVGYAVDQLPVFDRMTVDQLLDYAELNVVYGGWPNVYVTGHIPILNEYGYGDVKLVAYEGSIAVPVPGDGSHPNYATRVTATKRHPRMFNIVLQMAQSYQDAGLSLWNYFNLGGGATLECWEAYESGNMGKGTGDRAADAINVTNPLAKGQVLSEVGGAWHYWSTLVPAAIPTTPTSKQTLPGRNGRIRAVGYPRGAYRTTRSH